MFIFDQILSFFAISLTKILKGLNAQAELTFK